MENKELLRKIEILKSRGAKELMEKLDKYEDALEEALREDASFKNLNHEYLASSTNDCHEVKRIIAELSPLIPETSKEGKKLTAAEKESWLVRQRKENEELTAAINKQISISFIIENNQIKTDMARRRLDGVRGKLALVTAQINFLAA